MTSLKNHAEKHHSELTAKFVKIIPTVRRHTFSLAAVNLPT